MTNKDAANEIFCTSAQDLHNWLIENHTRTKGVWLVVYKGEKRTVTWSEIVPELLAFGWIDSKAGTIPPDKSKLWISPRKPKSVWSAVNKAHIENLIKQGRMQDSGLKAIEVAKQNGSWDILNDVENLIVPKDLADEFRKYKNAAQNFENFPKSAKKIILYWIISAKTAETRLKRIKDAAEKADKNIRANQ